MRLAASLFIAALAAACAPAVAQPDGRVATVGLLSDRSAEGAEPALLAAFRDEMRERGWVEGRNLAIVSRNAGDDPDRLPRLAAALVREGADVIFATTLPAALAAKGATQSVPIVFNVLPDPVAQGLVAALARPGANVTGVAINSSALIPKRLQLLKEALPGLARVAVLIDPNQDDACQSAWDALADPARAMGVSLGKVRVEGQEGYARAFDAMARARFEAVLVPATTRFYNDVRAIAAAAAAHHMVFMPSVGDVAEEFVLLSYGPLQSEAYRRAASYVDRILRGANPATLPVEQPTRYELVLNLRIARALEIEFPRSLRARADRLVGESR